MGDLLIPDFEIRDLILEYGSKEALKCYQCGMCAALCPWYQVDGVDFLVYQLAQNIKLGAVLNSEDKDVIAHEVTELYRCVGCDACYDQCPRGLNIADMLRAVRRIMVESESVPGPLRTTISSLYSNGNPLSQPPEKRTDWAKDLDLPAFQPEMEYAWFTCCTVDYDPRCQKIAQATAEILKRAGVSFGILGNEQSCCGEAIRKAGAEKAFKQVAESNIKLFEKTGAKKLLTTSPHCLNSFKKDYPELDGNCQVIHMTQLFARLIEQGEITPKKELNKRVVYHDPCTLGRQNNIYEEPRQVLKNIPGLELVEIPEFNHENSVCCGGGSGGLWLEWPKGERLADVRAKQAADTGAQILAVACPYCLTMFEDSVKTMNLDIQVLDVAELLAESLEP